MSASHPPMAHRTAGPLARPSLQETQRNLALWTLQAWLAMFFLAAGYTKLTQPRNLLDVLLGWTDQTPPVLVTGLGVLETALGLGVVASLITWRLRRLVTGSALVLSGLALVMLCLHLWRFEPGLALVNLSLAAFAVLVFIGRTREARR